MIVYQLFLIGMICLSASWQCMVVELVTGIHTAIHRNTQIPSSREAYDDTQLVFQSHVRFPQIKILFSRNGTGP